jgi:hypothetical protein
MRIRYRHSIFSALLVVGTVLGVSSAPPARAAGQDLFADTFGDALDYENPQDVTIASNWTMSGVANVSMSGGQLHLDSTGPGWVTLLFPGFEGALPNGREGARNPVNASDYGRLVLRMNTSASQPVAALWHTCVQANASCQGGHFFQSTSGWQTYDVPLTPTPGDPALSIPWAGTVVGLRLLFPAGTGHIDIDWARVVPNGASSVEELHDRPAPRLIDSKLDYATWAGNPWDFDDPTMPLRWETSRVRRLAAACSRRAMPVPLEQRATHLWSSISRPGNSMPTSSTPWRSGIPLTGRFLWSSVRAVERWSESFGAMLQAKPTFPETS